MRCFPRRIQAAVGVLILYLSLSQVAWTNLPNEDDHSDFYLEASASGTALYRKDNQHGYPEFVQVVHLDQGATIQLLHGRIIDPGIGQGVYGRHNPGFSTQTLQEVWDVFSLSHPNAFCITNGQFFSIQEDSTKLAFPLKIDGKIVSDGYGLNEFPNQKLMLEIWQDRVDIVPLSRARLQTSSASHILAGLSEDASGRRPNTPTGRTFIGVGDLNRDGKYGTILIFNSKVARKTDASSVLRSFGAEKVMMLDGGGSTQLLCQGEAYINAGRRIPQTIVVLAAIPPAYHESYRRLVDNSWFTPIQR
jgi:hypothetical protein